jgi:hypothetical protein
MTRDKRFPYVFAVSLLMFFGCASAYADSYTCAKTFRVVSTGDSIDTVKAACGEPTASTTRTDTIYIPNQIVRWFYMLVIDARKPAIPIFSVNFKDQKVIQIDKSEVFGPMLSGFSCIFNNTLRMGMSENEVLAMCGSPTSISTSEEMSTATKPVVVFLYDLGQFQQKVQFEFEESKVVRIKHI